MLATSNPNNAQLSIPPYPHGLAPDDQYLDQPSADLLAKNIALRWSWAVDYYRPLHQRMDYWMNMYLLLDLVQQSKPLGFRRFISNDPQTAVDAAISILTRNDSFWQIDLEEGLTKEQREKVGKLERALKGIDDDIDELFLTTGQMRLCKQEAFFALVRGAIHGKFHVTRAALDLGRPSPILAEMYDPRFDYPCYDGIGLSYFIAEKFTTWSEIYGQYEEQIAAAMRFDAAYGYDRIDPNTPFTKLEYWSNSRGPNRPGVNAVMAIMGTKDVPYSPPGHAMNVPGAMRMSTWLIPPWRHGLTPEQLPIVTVNVNGLPIKTKPSAGTLLEERLSQRADRIGLLAPSWTGPNGWIAESGRSILAHVEESVPQYNELVATIFQHFSMGTYPTWVFRTQTGELPDFEEGMNARVPLRIEESAQRLDPSPVTADAYRLVDILQEEKQKGVLANILQAVVPSGGNGIFFQQIANAALNALEPSQDGIRSFGTLRGSRILNQLKVAKDIPKFELVGRSTKSYFRLEFDPSTDLEDRRYKPVPIFNPALPDDFSIRAQAARILLDPRRPVMSLTTVLEKVLRVDDPEGEIDRIFEDMANLDPVIALERIADSLDKMGEGELASRVRQQEFAQKFQQDLRLRQIQSAAGVEGAIPMLGSATGNSLATGGGAPNPGQGNPGGSAAGDNGIGAAGASGYTATS